MINESRLDIYDYLYKLFDDVVSVNVYAIAAPKELTNKDTQNGFLVIRVTTLNDASEFKGEAYAWSRCYVTAYVPTVSRGRLDYDAFRSIENTINGIINDEIENTHNDTYSIQKGSIMSYDSFENANSDNTFYLYTKSFNITVYNNNNN